MGFVGLFHACTSFREDSVDANDAASEALVREAGMPDDAGADGAVTAFCDGHTLCWTFDEADASVPSADLSIEDGGVGGSKCLVATITSAENPSRQALYATVTRAITRRVTMSCSVRIDSLGSPTDGGPSTMPICLVTDAQLGASTFYGQVLAHQWPDGGPKDLEVVVGGLAGATVYCAALVSNPVPWTEAHLDVTWLADGGTSVDVSVGTTKKHCDGVVGRPSAVSVQPGVNGLRAGASPPSWKVALDNVTVDVE